MTRSALWELIADHILPFRKPLTGWLVILLCCFPRSVLLADVGWPGVEQTRYGRKGGQELGARFVELMWHFLCRTAQPLAVAD